LLDLVRLLVENKHDVLVLAPVAGPLVDRLERTGARVAVTSLRWWAGVTPRSLRNRAVTAAALAVRAHAIRHLVAGFQPDVAVTNTIATPALALAARSLRVPHIWLLHEYALPEQGFFLDLSRSATYRTAGALSTALLAASRTLATEVQALGSRECGVLYASVPDVKGAKPRVSGPGPPYQLLSLGHVTRAKRQDELVRSLALARRHGIDCHLVLVGRRDRDFEADLRHLVEKLQVQDHVAFEDETVDPGRWLATSHAMVSASRYEACPRVVVEAMKASLPVVACDSGGNAELLAQGRGWLYLPGDEKRFVQSLVAALKTDVPDTTAAASWAHRNFSDQHYLSTFLDVAMRAAG